MSGSGGNHGHGGRGGPPRETPVPLPGRGGPGSGSRGGYGNDPSGSSRGGYGGGSGRGPPRESPVPVPPPGGYGGGYRGGPPRGPPASRGGLAPRGGDHRAFSGPGNNPPAQPNFMSPTAASDNRRVSSMGPGNDFPASSRQSSVAPSEQEEVSFDKKYWRLFVDVSRENNVAYYNTDDRVYFQFKKYQTWILYDGQMPTPDDLKKKENWIQFSVDWESRKHLLVFANDTHLCKLIVSACPEIITSSLFFCELRNKAKGNMRAWKSHHLYNAFYGYIRKLVKDFPQEFSRNMNDDAQKKEFIKFLESKLDETTFAICFPYVYKQLNWNATTKHRSIWTDSSKSKHSPYLLIKQVFCSLGNQLAQLASREDAMNPGVNWFQSTAHHSNNKQGWTADMNFRQNTISKAFDAMTITPSFADIELHDFTWNAMPSNINKSGAADKPAKKRASDANVISQVMLSIEDDSDSGPPVKSPRIAPAQISRQSSGLRQSQTDENLAGPSRRSSIPPGIDPSLYGGPLAHRSRSNTPLDFYSGGNPFQSGGGAGTSGNTSRAVTPQFQQPPGGSNYPDPTQLGYGASQGPQGSGGGGEASSSSKARGKGKAKEVPPTDRVTRHGGRRTQRRADFRNMGMDGSVDDGGDDDGTESGDSLHGEDDPAFSSPLQRYADKASRYRAGYE